MISRIVEITFVALDGTAGTTSLNAGNILTFDPTTFTFTAPPTNSGAVLIIADDEQFSIAPSQTVISDEEDEDDEESDG